MINRHIRSCCPSSRPTLSMTFNVGFEFLSVTIDGLSEETLTMTFMNDLLVRNTCRGEIISPMITKRDDGAHRGGGEEERDH